MTDFFKSYKSKQQKKKSDICSKMRNAKERKRIEAEQPEYPVDRSEDYRVIHIEDSMNGKTTEHILLLTPAKNGRCDSWDVWLDAEYQGSMGWLRATKLIYSQFPHIRNCY